jgi:hypothetical protein
MERRSAGHRIIVGSHNSGSIIQKEETASEFALQIPETGSQLDNFLNPPG